MATTRIAIVQMACLPVHATNVDTAEAAVRAAAAGGAQIVLLPELFATPYFCKDQDPAYFDLAMPAAASPLLARMGGLARELGVVLPVSFFERDGTACFNALAMFDADGTRLGIYRKAHVPQGPGYEEKYYFTPGDRDFQVWHTAAGCLGVGICWDQWFPEMARILCLLGADLLLYPTAIGSEPQDPACDSQPHWQRTMQGHAAANLVPLAAANRIGTEVGASCALSFYGSSFIAGPTGEIVAAAGRDAPAVLTADFDFAALRRQRHAWGLFRDRRPDLYQRLLGH